MKLQRYEYSDRHGSMVQDKNGPWVHFSDTESLQAQLAAANERADGLQKIVDAARAQKPVYLFRRRGLDNFCTCDRERYLECKELPKLFEVWELYASAPVPAQPAAVPEEVMRAVDRMCKPLDDSWLGSQSATAQADARCMKVIRDYILSTTDTEGRKDE